MFFESKMSLMPKDDIEIAKKMPTKVFGKFLHALTFGVATENEQRMTKTAVNILQMLNIALMNMDITNIIRLSKNGYDFYFDKSGKDDDLKEAMLEFNFKNDSLSSELFETLFLVVEHEDEHLKYLIEVDVDRITWPGKKPITITVNGLVNEFNSKGKESVVKTSMEAIFEKADTYKSFVESHRNIFDSFCDRLSMEIKKVIPCENFVSSSKANIFKEDKPSYALGSRQKSTPLFSHGYYGYENSSVYTWFWMDMIVGHNMHIHDVDILDSDSHPTHHIGEEGVSGEQCNDLSDYSISNESSSDLSESESSSWLSSDDSHSSDSFDSSSSCSSCSSCGGD